MVLWTRLCRRNVPTLGATSAWHVLGLGWVLLGARLRRVWERKRKCVYDQNQNARSGVDAPP